VKRPHFAYNIISVVYTLQQALYPHDLSWSYVLRT